MSSAATRANKGNRGRSSSSSKRSTDRFVQRPGLGSLRRDKHGNETREITLVMTKGLDERRVTVGGLKNELEAQRIWDVLNIARHIIHKQDPQQGRYHFPVEQYAGLLHDIKTCGSVEELHDYCITLVANNKLRPLGTQTHAHTHADTGAKPRTGTGAPAATAPLSAAMPNVPGAHPPQRTSQQQQQQQQVQPSKPEPPNRNLQHQQAQPQHEQAQPQRQQQQKVKKRKRRHAAGTEEGVGPAGVICQGDGASPQQERCGSASQTCTGSARGGGAPPGCRQAAAALPPTMGDMWVALNRLQPLLREQGLTSQEEIDFSVHFGYDASPAEQEALYHTLRRALMEGDRASVAKLVRRAGAARQ